MALIVFMGSSQKKLREMPKRVKVQIGFALADAQWGGKAVHTKVLKNRKR